jgi:hypothetical protein
MTNHEEKAVPPKPRYTWPWYVAGAVVLAIVLAILWMSKEVERVKRIRDANKPQSSARAVDDPASAALRVVPLKLTPAVTVGPGFLPLPARNSPRVMDAINLRTFQPATITWGEWGED